MAGSTGSYERDVDTLERELTILEDTFRGLSDEDWSNRTHLQPIDPELPRWTLLELAAHFDISIGLTRALDLPCRSTPEAISTTASILDELLARRTVAGRTPTRASP
jgi:hypothetical protein